LFDNELQAQRELVCGQINRIFLDGHEVKDFAEGTDSIKRPPVSFGDAAAAARQAPIRCPPHCGKPWHSTVMI